MGTLALIVRLLLAAVFAVAGLAKLSDLKGTAKSIGEFGFPEWSINPLRALLPIAELLASALMISSLTVLWGSLASITLLLLFIAAISVNLAQGRKPKCNCFGQIHSEPVGRPTLIRNFVLVLSAIFVLWQCRARTPLGIIAWTKGRSETEILAVFTVLGLLILLAVCGWLIVKLFEQNGRLLLRMDDLERQFGRQGATNLPLPSQPGLPVGVPAPNFELHSLYDHSAVTLDTLLSDRLPAVIVFSDPECAPCSALLPDITKWEREYADVLTFALLSRGTKEVNLSKLGALRLRYILLQRDREVGAAYRANSTPVAVLISADGKIASLPAMGAVAITELVAKAVTSRALSSNGIPRGGKKSLTPGSMIGQVAPSLKLSDLSDHTVDLALRQGREKLLLFWNPSCGFCVKMLPDLKEWEQHQEEDTPELFLISSGSIEANRAMGLRSPIFLDQTFSSGSKFGVRGTPAAVLIGADGRIRSGVANGASAVFALALENKARSI